MPKPLRCLVLLSVIVGFSANAQPTGIYVLDNSNGNYRDANIRSYTFVNGYVWRWSWADIETSQGVYNFAGLDHIVKRLDSLNQKLTILFGAYSVEPPYVAANAAATYSFYDPVSAVTTTRAVPWDAYLMARFRLFMAALASHQVYSMSAGANVPLSTHPVLANITANIPGLGAIRNVNSLTAGLHTTLTGYARQKFADSLIASLKVHTDYFPTKNVFIPFYKSVTDNVSAPQLATYIRTRLLQGFNGVANPKISFWQENLAAYKDTVTKVVTGLPTTTNASIMYQLNDSAYTMFQMLQGWTHPFSDPAKVANTTPVDAMCYAYKTYGTRYFEIYADDIDNTLYQPLFASWSNGAVCNTAAAVSNAAGKLNDVLIYPNPAKDVFIVANLPVDKPCIITVSDMTGKGLIVTDSRQVDISGLSNGVYRLSVSCGSATICRKLMKQ